jgi:hypothetical protein
MTRIGTMILLMPFLTAAFRPVIAQARSVTAILTGALFSSPTPLSQNLAMLAPTDVTKSLAYGGFTAAFFLIVLGAFLRLCRK